MVKKGLTLKQVIIRQSIEEIDSPIRALFQVEFDSSLSPRTVN